MHVFFFFFFFFFGEVAFLFNGISTFMRKLMHKLSLSKNCSVTGFIMEIMKFWSQFVSKILWKWDISVYFCKRSLKLNAQQTFKFRNLIFYVSSYKFCHENYIEFSKKVTNQRALLQGNYLIHSREMVGVHIFLKGISPKENVIELLEFELAYFEVLIQHFSLYANIYISRPFDYKDNHFKTNYLSQLILSVRWFCRKWGLHLTD